MVGSFKDLNVFITGGSSGIGKATIMALAEKKVKSIAFTYNTHEKEAQEILDLLSQKGIKGYAFKADFSKVSKEDMEGLFSNVVTAVGGQVDILVNNAGKYAKKDFLEIDDKDYDVMMNINYKAPLFLSQSFIKHRLELSKKVLDSNKQSVKGKIINISTICVTEGSNYPGRELYDASKTSFSKAIGGVTVQFCELIDVAELRIGVTETGMNENVRNNNPEAWEERKKLVPEGKAATSEQVAREVILAAKSQGSSMRVVADGAQHLVGVGFRRG